MIWLLLSGVATVGSLLLAYWFGCDWWKLLDENAGLRRDLAEARNETLKYRQVTDAR